MIAGSISVKPILVWNASASAPLGLYLRVDDTAEIGDYVLVRTPPPVRDLAAERGYLPASVPMVKRIAADRGDLVCASGRTVSINGHIEIRRLEYDREGRPLPFWLGCRHLANDETFLLMADVSDSFDGRYFGPISRTAIIGKLVPIWLE